MTTIVKNYGTDFPNGLNLGQLQSEINASGISTTCTGITRNSGTVSIVFAGVLTAGDTTTVGTVISEHYPEPPAFAGLSFITIDTTSSPYRIKKYSVYCDTSAGNVVINLPTASRTKNAYIGVKKIAAANTVTVNAAGSDLINGASSTTLKTRYQWILLQSNGAGSWSSSTGQTAFDPNTNMNNLFYTNNKGDLQVDNGATVNALPVGADGQVLIADSTQPNGMRWGGVSGASAMMYIGDQCSASCSNGTSHTYAVTAGKKYRIDMQLFDTKTGGSVQADIGFDVSSTATTTWGSASALCRQNYAMATGEVYVFSGWAIVTPTGSSLTIIVKDASTGSGTYTLTYFGTSVFQLN